VSFPAKLSLGGGAFQDVTVSKLSTSAGLVDVTLGNPPGSGGSPTPPPTPVPPGAPNPPTGVKATATSNTSLDLSWTAATVAAGSPAVTGYRVYNALSVLLKTVGNVTSTTFSGLTPGTSYSYFVTAVNSAGESGPSTIATAKTTNTTTVRRLGIYNGGPTTDDAAQTSFGRYPDIASTYYQFSAGLSATNITNETTRINKGICPLLTISTNGTTYEALIASGDATALSKLDAYVAALDKLSRVNPNVSVYATFDHEFEVKVNQNTVTGTSADLGAYGRNLSLFVSKCRANAPLVKVGYWCGGSDKTKILTVLQNITTPLDWISVDPYATKNDSASSTPASTWGPVLSWFRTGAAATQYARLGSPPLAISETGDDTSHGDTAVAAFFTNFRQTMVDQNVLFAVLFNRNKVDNNGVAVAYQIDTGAFPKSVAAYSASLASKVAG